MTRFHRLLPALFLFACFSLGSIGFTPGSSALDSATGAAAKPADNPFTDFRAEAPGVVHRINVGDLPAPYATDSAQRNARIVQRPKDAWIKVPAGFKAELYASGLDNPRLLRTAPNGDVFVAESEPGRIHVYHGITKDGKPQMESVFATRIHQPFGINFYPPGPNPQYVYVANTDSVVRFPYKNGDLQASAAPEVVVRELPSGSGHWTRDLAFSPDGKKMYVAVGSSSNVDDADNNPKEFHRANILEFNPDGSGLRVYASGIRNPVGIAVDPQTGELWTSVNERDELGDNLPPDYITHVQENGFYGWPWYYTGAHQDPRLKGKHPELKDKVIVPDVLLEPHNASLELTFYEGQQFPAKFRGGIFAGEHGSWNRESPTGYEIIFVPLQNGKSNGSYEDFATGFITADGQIWGRPVGVTVASDGSLLLTDDGSNSVWRISYAGP
jgi:glucose/arabinose dehydrogenase